MKCKRKKSCGMFLSILSLITEGWGKNYVYTHKRPDKFKETFVNKIILEKLITRGLAEETSQSV
jgi:hypothetical protein